MPAPKAGKRHTPRVMLVAPFAPCGGGIGRQMQYLAMQGGEIGVRFEKIESRGGGPSVWSAWYTLRAAIRIVRAAFLSNASSHELIVHLNVAEGASLARKGILLWLATALGTPAILHLHAAEILDFYAPLPRRAKALVSAMFRRADVCIVLGTPWRAWLIDELGVDPSRIVIVHNGVPQPDRDRIADTSTAFTLVFLGNLQRRKGLPDLLHALAAMKTQVKRPWQLVVAGGGGNRHLRRLAAELGIDDRVAFAGWLGSEAATELLRRADALVLPSYREGLPLVLLEAASLGVPVITTYVGAVPELFTDTRDALLVPPGDRAALAYAINRLIGDPALARQLGENCRCLYHRSLTIELFAHKIGDIYARLARKEELLF